MAREERERQEQERSEKEDCNWKLAEVKQQNVRDQVNRKHA